MARNKQNQVPELFDGFYEPLLRLKRIVQRNKANFSKLDNEYLLQGLIMLHFASFMLCDLFRQCQQDKAKAFKIRELTESILENDELTFLAEDVAKISSHIDFIGKILNTTNELHLYIAIYVGYLDSEIYFNFHHDLSIYKFRKYQMVSSENLENMKLRHDHAQVIIKQITDTVHEDLLG